MKNEELRLLFQERASLSILNQLCEVVENATPDARKRLADRAVTESQVGITINSSVNGFILYILCLGEGVSIRLLQEYWFNIEAAVFRHWNVTIKRLGPKDAFDPVIRSVAMHTYHHFVELTNNR